MAAFRYIYPLFFIVLLQYKGGSARDQDFLKERLRMVKVQIQGRGITDKKVLDAMKLVPRHKFVPDAYIGLSYADRPLPIGKGQTISQPYIVALMTRLLELRGGEKVLEIGTGSGYQAAVLAEIAGRVFTIEIVKELSYSAGERLKKLGYTNITVRAGDGYKGWPEESPFDGIIVTAAPDHVPEPLKKQLKVGGKMVIPVGKMFQKLYVIERTDKGFIDRYTIPVRFVPMTGEAERRKK